LHAQVTTLVKEVEVSHWGNIYIEENYEVVGLAVQLGGAVAQHQLSMALGLMFNVALSVVACRRMPVPSTRGPSLASSMLTLSMGRQTPSGWVSAHEGCVIMSKATA
jgi:hypothetical protein